MGDKDDDDDPGALVNTKIPCMPSLVALQQMRNRLHLAYLGKKLMKWSALAAGREMRRVGSLLIEAYDGFSEECSTAYIMLARCRFHLEILNKIVLENLQKQACITITTNVKSSGGIKLKTFALEEIEPAPAAYPHLGIGVGGQLITDTKRAWAALLKKLTLILELREAFIDLDYSFKSSTKKENVLGKLVIPRLNGTIHYILQELEELQREELFRIKKVVQYKTRAREKKVKKPAPCPVPLKTEPNAGPMVIIVPLEPPKLVPLKEEPLKEEPIKETKIFELPNAIKQCCCTQTIKQTQPKVKQTIPHKVELPKIPAGKPDTQIKMMSPETCVECIASELPESCHECIGLGTWEIKESKSFNFLIPKLSDTRSRRSDEIKTQDNLDELIANISELKLLAAQLHTPSNAKSLNVDSKSGTSKISVFDKTLHDEHIKFSNDRIPNIESHSKNAIEDELSTYKSQSLKFESKGEGLQISFDDKSLHDEDVKTLNDQEPQIENLKVKPKDEMSTKTEKFLDACKDFKNRVEELKVNPPKAGTDINKIMKQLDEAIALSSGAKKNGVNGNVDKFIGSCEDLKKLLKRTPSSSSHKDSDEIPKPIASRIFDTLKGFKTSAENIINSKSQGEKLNVDPYSQLHIKIINYIRGHGSTHSLANKSTLSLVSIKKPISFFKNEQPKPKNSSKLTLSKTSINRTKSKENIPLAQSKTNTKKTRSLSNTPLPGSKTYIVVQKEPSSDLTAPTACSSKSQGSKEKRISK